MQGHMEAYVAAARFDETLRRIAAAYQLTEERIEILAASAIKLAESSAMTNVEALEQLMKTLDKPIGEVPAPFMNRAARRAAERNQRRAR